MNPLKEASVAQVYKVEREISHEVIDLKPYRQPTSGVVVLANTL